MILITIADILFYVRVIQAARPIQVCWAVSTTFQTLQVSQSSVNQTRCAWWKKGQFWWCPLET